MVCFCLVSSSGNSLWNFGNVYKRINLSLPECIFDLGILGTQSIPISKIYCIKSIQTSRKHCVCRKYTLLCIRRDDFVFSEMKVWNKWFYMHRVYYLLYYNVFIVLNKELYFINFVLTFLEDEASFYFVKRRLFNGVS